MFVGKKLTNGEKYIIYLYLNRYFPLRCAVNQSIYSDDRSSNTRDKMSRNFTFNIFGPFLSEGIVRCVVCLIVGPSVFPSRPVYDSKPIISNDSCSYLIQQLTQWVHPPIDNVNNPAALWIIMNTLTDYCLGPALVSASPPHNIQCIFLMLEPILIVGHLCSFSRSFYHLSFYIT